MTKAEIAAALVAGRCFCGLSKTHNDGLQAYFLAVINGLSTNIGTLVSLTACQQCAPKSQQDDILAWIISDQTGVTGTAEQVINSSPCIRCIPPGYLEVFKTYMLYTAALLVDPGVISPIPFQAIEDAPSWVSTPTIVESVGTYISRNYPSRNIINPAACVAVVTNGGGDLFDCYNVGETNNFLPAAGTAFTGNWIFSENPFGHAFGDTFQDYSVGAAGTLNRGTGFPGAWIYA